MSRLYFVEMEMLSQDFTEDTEDEILSEFFNHDFKDISWNSKAIKCFAGEVTLGGGRTEQTAHNDLKERLGVEKLITRWQYIEERKWDEEIGSLD